MTPRTARALGIADTLRHRAEVPLAFSSGVRVRTPVEVKDIIHDGVINAATIARAVWTVDLATSRMWVGP
ncbi:MAG TPA: hypothetical protein VD948_06815, partial [Rhodothermales bacterium]|nr:hypothetical protein [Rhodothermales bacterium]